MKCSSMAMTFIGVLLIELGAFGHGKIQHLGREPGVQLRDHSHGNEGDELQDQVGKRTSPHLRDRHRAPGGAVHQEQRVAEGRRQERGLQVDGKERAEPAGCKLGIAELHADAGRDEGARQGGQRDDDDLQPVEEKAEHEYEAHCGDERQRSPVTQRRCGGGDHRLAAKQAEDEREDARADEDEEDHGADERRAPDRGVERAPRHPAACHCGKHCTEPREPCGLSAGRAYSASAPVEAPTIPAAGAWIAATASVASAGPPRTRPKRRAAPERRSAASRLSCRTAPMNSSIGTAAYRTSSRSESVPYTRWKIAPIPSMPTLPARIPRPAKRNATPMRTTATGNPEKSAAARPTSINAGKRKLIWRPAS